MNRIINIGPVSESAAKPASDEIYTDVDMLSKANPEYTGEKYKNVELSDYIQLLAIEGYDDEFDDINLKKRDSESDPPDGKDPDPDRVIPIAVLAKPNYNSDLHRSLAASWQSKYKVARNVNVRAVQNSLDNIFTWIPGERVLDPEFGNRLYLYLYEGITEFNVEQIMSEIKNVCLKYEPRVNIVKVVNVGNVADTEDNIVRLDIQYTIKGLPDEIFSKQYIFNRSVV